MTFFSQMHPLNAGREKMIGMVRKGSSHATTAGRKRVVSVEIIHVMFAIFTPADGVNARNGRKFCKFNFGAIFACIFHIRISLKMHGERISESNRIRSSFT